LRIGVLSDTHRKLDLARKALKDIGKLDLLLHAGDHYQDALTLGKEFNVPVKAVVGNCDFFSNKPSEEVLQLGKYKLLLTHGHQYGVKRGLQNIYYRGLETGVDIIVFGHTHTPVHIIHEGMHILNPGSIGLPRGNSGPSYALITIEPELSIVIKEIGK